MHSVYLNRFMDPALVVESLEDAACNPHVRKLILHGIHLDKEPIRGAILSLCTNSCHDWEGIEFKSCLGPLHEVVAALFASKPPSSLEERNEQDCATVQLQQVSRNMRTIHHLSLMAAELDERVTVAIAEGLASTATTTCIRKLTISGTKVVGVNMMALRQWLENVNQNPGERSSFSQFDALSFTTSHLEREAVTELAAGLRGTEGLSPRQHIGLKKLDLFSCYLPDESVAELITTLHHGRHPIEELDLGKNKCGSAGLVAIGQLLADPRSVLKWLSLFFQQPGHGDHDTASASRLEQQGQQQHQVLDLSLMTDGLAVNKSLVSLILRGNRVTDSSLESLSGALTQNETLRRLNMTDCRISREALHSFTASVLAPTCQQGGIQKLWLDGGQSFGTGREGASGGLVGRRELLGWLKDALQSNVSLEELYLPFGYFEDRSSSKEVSLCLDLNRGGRRLIMFPQAGLEVRNFVPFALWPLVLERVNHFGLFMGLRHQHKNEEELQKATSRRATVMYKLLRGHVLLQTP